MAFIIEDNDVYEAMQKHGGSFVQALGKCFQLADQINRGKLMSLFSGYYEIYKKLARDDAERAESLRTKGD